MGRINSFTFMEQQRAADSQAAQMAIEANTPTETTTPKMQYPVVSKAKSALGQMVVILLFVGVAAYCIGIFTNDPLFNKSTASIPVV